MNAGDIIGVLQCFAAQKTIEMTAMDTGVNWKTAELLLDRLRMAATLVGQNERERTKFEHCQVEADETVIRKERI